MFRLSVMSGPTKLKGNRIHLTGNLILDIYDYDVDDGDDNQIVEEFTLDEPSGVENGDWLNRKCCHFCIQNHRLQRLWCNRLWRLQTGVNWLHYR